jgi:hypothetical protein
MADGDGGWSMAAAPGTQGQLGASEETDSMDSWVWHWLYRRLLYERLLNSVPRAAHVE